MPVKPTDVDAALLASRRTARMALIPLLCRRGMHKMRLLRASRIDTTYTREYRCSRCKLTRMERSNY